MSIFKGDMMIIGVVNLERFKQLANTIKKKVEGCKHGHALDKLARSCGMRHYSHLMEIHREGLRIGQLMQGSRDDLLAEWRSQLTAQFGVDIGTIFSAEQLDVWFRRVFVDRSRLVSDVEGEDPVITDIHDPSLEAANWRDAEFRQWLQGVVDTEMKRSRSRGEEPRERVDSDEADAGRAKSNRELATLKAEALGT